MVTTNINIYIYLFVHIKYRGLRLLLVNWMDKGFDNYLNKLLKMVSCYTQIQANDKVYVITLRKFVGSEFTHDIYI